MCVCECQLDLVIFLGGANFTEILTDLYNKSNSANSLLRRLLNLPEAEEEEDESFSLSGGVIAAIVIAAVLVTGAVILCLTLPPVLLAKRCAMLSVVLA